MIRLRILFRLLRVALHILWGCLLVLAMFGMWGPARRRVCRQRWSADLLHILAIQTRVIGKAPPAGRLVVSNHISWLDIFVLNAVSHVKFVCKDDVLQWPVLGWLIARNDTIFISRRVRSDAKRVSGEITTALSRGDTVVVFPEGTSTDGKLLLPFHAALFQPALDTQTPVYSVGLRYSNHKGQISTAPAYWGNLSILDSLVALGRQPYTIAEVNWLKGLSAADVIANDAAQGITRQDLALASRELIACALALPKLDTSPKNLDHRLAVPPLSNRPTDTPCQAPTPVRSA